MANDKSKIIAQSGNIYIAATGRSLSLGTDLDDWIAVGWCEGGSIKLSPAERHDIELHNSSKFKLSTTFKFEATGLETDLVKIQALEELEEDHVDIVLMTGALTGMKFSNFGFMVDADFVFSEKTPKKTKLEAMRVAKNFSEFYSAVSLTPS